MSQDDIPKRENRLSGLTNAFRRKRDDSLEIDDFHVGDIRAESAVNVLRGAMLIGDLLAPEIIVSGLVYGYVACRRLIVAPGGQIWGDVYVNALELSPTGKINGWMCTLDTGTVDLLRAGELGKGDLPDQDDLHLPAELLERVQSSGADVEADQKQSQRRSGIWRQLRSEAALALIARSEIETTFDQRMEAALTEYTAENAELRERLNELNGDNELQDLAAEDPVTQVQAADVEQLQRQLRQATAAAQKYYSELLWNRAALRAARRAENDS